MPSASAICDVITKVCLIAGRVKDPPPSTVFLSPNIAARRAGPVTINSVSHYLVPRLGSGSRKRKKWALGSRFTSSKSRWTMLGTKNGRLLAPHDPRQTSSGEV
jgi:hypothetical protein